MCRENKINTKAFQQLVYYFLQERVNNNGDRNNSIRHLIATNFYTFFIFDAADFEKIFYNNKKFLQNFKDFQAKKLSPKKTNDFYKEIGDFVENLQETIPYTFLDLQQIKGSVGEERQKKLEQRAYKILSRQYLLKDWGWQDKNVINNEFYQELLYILGLQEIFEHEKKDCYQEKPQTSNKKIIYKLDTLNKETFLENIIQNLEGKNIENFHPEEEVGEEKTFAVALELCITWINRILFLKLLEGQIDNWNNGGEKGKLFFLKSEKIRNYGELNELFFEVLGKKENERTPHLKQKFPLVPYLNSSLFEKSNLEKETISINSLGAKEIDIYPDTVLKDDLGKKLQGRKNNLEYLFEFLNAFDFASDYQGQEDKNKKTIINPAVLGLIFEKINGYKDGAFYTPSFITQHLSEHVLRQVVVQKFNEDLGQNFQSFNELKNKLEEVYPDYKNLIPQVNKVLNSIKICDPSVGSGHFLVSALNQMIKIKYDLNVLADEKNNTNFGGYNIDLENDEIVVYYKGKYFKYDFFDKQSQDLQKTLFLEKQKIIENCLFGVDLNPTSVEICRLRLWIELLKNAYYKGDNDDKTKKGQLETLPNIDINIKVGNSILSQFELGENLNNIFKNKENSGENPILDYKNFVKNYKNIKSKQEKQELEKKIREIKENFTKILQENDKLKQELKQKRQEFEHKFGNENALLGTAVLDKSGQKEKEKLQKEIENLQQKISDKENNTTFKNAKAFEWRFEFPEVLDEKGNFLGFDLVIGNPPYINFQKLKNTSEILQNMEKSQQYESFAKNGDIYQIFYERGHQILKQDGFLAYITSNKWMRSGYGEKSRAFFTKHTQPKYLADLGSGVFDNATVDTNILIFQKSRYKEPFFAFDHSKHKTKNYFTKNKNFNLLPENTGKIFPQKDEAWIILSEIEQRIKEKIEAVGTPLKDWDIQINYGIKTGFNEAFIINGEKRKELIEADPKSEEIIRPILRGRDIKRYDYDFADLYLLFIPWHFPLHENQNITGASKEAEQAFENQYPAIYNHLLQYKTQLSNRNKAETGIRYEWYALQRWGANYWEEFSKQKIAWNRIASEKQFSLVDKGFVIQDSMHFFTGNKLEFLCSVLNSKLYKFLMSLIVGQAAGGNAGNADNVKNLKIVFPNEDLENKITQFFKSKNYIGVDKIIYKLYNLTDEEIDFIEKATNTTEDGDKRVENVENSAK